MHTTALFQHQRSSIKYSTVRRRSLSTDLVKDVSETERQRSEADGSFDRSEAVAGIIKAGLRMVASELVDQLTQHSAAESDFYEQVRNLDKARKKSRLKYLPKKK